MPDRHLAWADHTPGRYLEWARSVGPQVQSVVEMLLADARYPAGALNACISLQKLCRTHQPDRFILACAKALSIQSPTVKSIRSILQNHLEGRIDGRSAPRNLPLHGNVHGASYYQAEEVTVSGG